MDYNHKNPENEEQKSKFDTRSNVLPLHVLKGVEESLKQFEIGQFISLEEFKKKHFLQYP